MDNIDAIWEKFFSQRSQTLWTKFPGHYRAMVVETNDPLNMNRIRFKCPDLHDFNIDANDCPWAVPNFDLGGKRAGRFVAPVIGDWVWITFERQHPYGPIWVGFADPTRKKQYTYQQVHGTTPTPVNMDGSPDARPKDYNLSFAPRDRRPMSHGWVDRYGNADIHSSVGFYPVEHAHAPPPPDHDAVAGTQFTQVTQEPVENLPDMKYMVRITKYGHIFLMGDQGYTWRAEGTIGEFTGDAEKDEPFESKRWLYLQKLINEGKPSTVLPGTDQRRMLMLTRYGTKFELRDVGWGQAGPLQSSSRVDEYSSKRFVLSIESERDQRWAKIRTKGGMLFQAYDKGCHPMNDKFVKRPLLQEVGDKSENEHIHWGGNKDARWIRLCTRYGLKFVLDDRGSDELDADGKELPRGNGILLKGRRTPSSKAIRSVGNARGFLWEFNENDEANHTTWASPLGQAMEINDRYQYTMIAVSMGKGWVPKYRGLKENEFIRKPLMMNFPEFTSHHLKLDHDNEYIRFKTRGGSGQKPDKPLVKSGVGYQEIQQGFEARDGASGDGPWVELVDCQHRGMWFSKKQQIGVWRGKKRGKMYQWIEEKEKRITIYNNEEAGVIEIYCNKDVNVIAKNSINMQADGNIKIRAGKNIEFQAGGNKLTMYKNRTFTNSDFNAPKMKAFFVGVMAGPGGGPPSPGGETIDRIDPPELPNAIEPTDRGKTYNGPFEECPIVEVEHTVRG